MTDPQKINVVFQSTLPARGATAQNVGQNYIADNFNPRSPHGERRRRKRRV